MVLDEVDLAPDDSRAGEVALARRGSGETARVRKKAKHSRMGLKLCIIMDLRRWENCSQD